jgi:hypothetical protein
MVTRGTKPAPCRPREPMSATSWNPAESRRACSRLADFVNILDPKVIAATFGMTAESVMIYLADRVDQSCLTEQPKRS